MGRHRQSLTVKMLKNGDPAGRNAIPARAQLGPDWQEIAKSGQMTCS